MAWPNLLQELSNEPHMTKWVNQGTLKHPLDRMRADRRVRMFTDGISLNSSGGHSVLVHRNGIVYKELDPHSCETCGGWAARAISGRLLGQEEVGAVN